MTQLLIRPPRDPESLITSNPVQAFDDLRAPCPDPAVGGVLAELSHCRPCGAFFVAWMADEWTNAGGRETCRKPLFCPHCHARQVTRLVGRVEAGPWSDRRRRDRQLVMLRLAVPTTDLPLDRGRLDAEREQLGFEDWLRTSTPEYIGDPGDEAMIRAMEADQELGHTLTPHEVASASELARELVRFARSRGVSGGLRVHQIGPRRRQFLHEIAVVGEVRAGDVPRLAMAAGLDEGTTAPRLRGQAVECVLLPPGYHDAARVLIAGTSCGFDLLKVGARLNEPAMERTYWTSYEWAIPHQNPVGLRGALAWPPLFLLSGASYWSRYKVLGRGRHSNYHTFGTWRGLMDPDRAYRSEVEQQRWVKAGGPIKEGWARDPARRLELRREQLGVSKADLARAAGCSRAAAYRFIKDGYGSPELAKALTAALKRIETEQSPSANPMKFTAPEQVVAWLEGIGRTQAWLAERIDWKASRVSRQLSGKTKWQREFGQLVENVAKSPDTPLDGS